MALLLQLQPDKRHLPALAFHYEEATNKGFIYREMQRAADMLDWQFSPAEAVTRDQAASRAHSNCGSTASVCPERSVPLVSRTLFGGCKVATCMHASPSMGAEKSSSTQEMFTSAVESSVPELLAEAKDLEHFNESIKHLVKRRKQVRT